METVSIGVVAHITRQPYAEALSETVNANVVSVDDGSLGCEGNHRRVWEQLTRAGGHWAVVLEDDAVPVPHFATQLHNGLAHAPTPVVSLYLGRMRPPWAQHAAQIATTEADNLDADWIMCNHMLHAVGYAIRTDHLRDLLAYPPTNTPIDQHITQWSPTLISYTWGSLVDHADIPTVVNHPDGQPRTPGRVAWKTQAHHKNWSTRSVTMRI